ncbi:thiamine-phosphate kinase [Cellulomonas marina]|uniref:Thiamine-monophosphate kinase n=1 Tax=Cellulomonas marina TaxID=988821 RepID=A0A1I0YQ39_9CELL|nr:thiamine-phosphate kinase [Cellulomonas marina]GIG27609.1 thiamine-monophosphate kinase [Cellulomonas marina]SFB14916.1 thiamine-monophosphate kinase [Cellulomonas marina]
MSGPATTPDADPGTRVRDLDEEALLAAFVPLLPVGDATLVPPGDDAAVVAAPDGRFVVTTDVLVEDRHFRRRWSTGRDVGRRAAVQNLADVAAMGARPTAVVVALAVPSDLPVAWVVGLAQGLADVCAPLGVGVVGGDLSGGDAVVVSVAAHGDLEGRPPVRRSGARPGDVVAHAGRCGRSAAGLALLTAHDAGWSGPGSAAGPGADDELVAAFLRPEAPLGAGAAAARAGATAMLDVSDGLLRDAGRLARASGVLVDLDAPAVAFAAERARLAPVAAALGVDVDAWLLTGGEDHGLLATFPSGVALPEPFRAVGRVRPMADASADASAGTATGARVLVAGSPPHVTGTGWDHFARGVPAAGPSSGGAGQPRR